MSEGIHVFGAASMGALRAAELEAFGMVGVGAIFQSYRDGLLEDDDEVAVAHASAENGYRAGSDAMVNIRATLARARREGILSEPAAATLERIAKGLFYADRCYARMMEAAENAVVAPELEAFRRWLPDGAVDQKRQDAVAMLHAMRELLASEPGPKRVSYFFEETTWWDTLRRSAGEVASGLESDTDTRVLEQLGRDPRRMARATAAALGWWLAADEARREGQVIDAAALIEESQQFCRAHGLTDAAGVEEWLKSNRCARQGLERIFEAHALASWAEAHGGKALRTCLLDYLRWTGEYGLLLERAGAR
jgi:hypothetical protein